MPSSSTSPSGGGPPIRTFLILTLTAGYLLPSTGAIQCYKCEYGPQPDEPTGATLPCTSGNPPEAVVDCHGGEDGCFTVHALGFQDGKQLVKGYGGCMKPQGNMDCLQRAFQSMAFSPDLITHHAHEKTCTYTNLSPAKESKASDECLHQPQRNGSIGGDITFELCPCFGDRCNDGSKNSPHKLTQKPHVAVITDGAPPSSLLTTITGAVTFGVILWTTLIMNLGTY